MADNKKTGNSPRFELIINGERVCTAGLEQFGVLSLICSYVLRDPARFVEHEGGLSREEWGQPNFNIDLGGIDYAVGYDKSIGWFNRRLGPGDEFTVRILPPGDYDEHVHTMHSSRPVPPGEEE